MGLKEKGIEDVDPNIVAPDRVPGWNLYISHVS
jgi:hypothetical protein